MKIIKNSPSVVIAICAYNEEANIQKCLESIFLQKQVNFTIKEVIVYIDGSTDHTLSKIKNVKGDVTIYQGKKRKGKSTRLNQIYTKSNADILVQCDADIILKHAHVLGALIKPFLTDAKIGMVGGNAQPIKATTFIEKAINISVKAYTSLRKYMNNGNNIFTVNGRLLAIRKDLYKSTLIPPESSANDAYLYFTCLLKKYTYKYVSSAIVLYRSPQTIADHIRQNSRFISAEMIMKKYFSHSFVEQEYSIPLKLVFYTYSKAFIKAPLLSLTLVAINTYCRVKCILSSSYQVPYWGIAYSTKLVNN